MYRWFESLVIALAIVVFDFIGSVVASYRRRAR